tara:strand:+ start:2669 stop:3490 length:822 start_codon:yes stop_codon:yes gene_type:complete
MDFPQDIFQQIVSFCGIQRSQVKKVLEVGTYFVENRFNQHTGGSNLVAHVQLRELIRIKVHRRTKCFVWFSLHKTIENCPLDSIRVPVGEIIRAKIRTDENGFEFVALTSDHHLKPSIISEREIRAHYLPGRFWGDGFYLDSRLVLHPIYKRDVHFTQKTWDKFKTKFTWEKQLLRIFKENPLPDYLANLYKIRERPVPECEHIYLREEDVFGRVFFRTRKQFIPISVWIEKLEQHILIRKIEPVAFYSEVPDWDVLQFQFWNKLLDLWRSWE